MRKRFIFSLIFCFLLGCASDTPEPLVDESQRYPGGDTTNPILLGVNAFIQPVDNLKQEHEEAFYSGNSFFTQAWVMSPASTTDRDGLGPFFNARACSSCHPKDGRGAPPEDEDGDFVALLLRLSVPGEGPHGAPKPHPVYGDQFQPSAIVDLIGEGIPSVQYEEIAGEYDDGTPYSLLKPTYGFKELNYGPIGDDTMISPRIAPQVIGMGLLDAIPTERLQALEDPNDTDGDQISGRLNMVWDDTEQALAPGRFGWKGDASTVRQQVAGAFAGDIGITSPVIPTTHCGENQDECASIEDGGSPEISERFFDFVVVYTSLVAVPYRRNWGDADVESGQAVFHQLGCDGCHTPRHVTGDHALEELSNQVIWPYTDLLLHDMGEGLADGRPVFLANGREWKTPPLWSLGLIPKVNKHSRYLHDGRARNLAEAILWHGGEAEASQKAFKSLSAEKRQQLLRFLESI